ncbi:DUF2778 domain-containing protein [Ancylobacter terrae]|uniref:DUF2778 domain-containing protein n=1 Tax=Ancylobacter sp. sgz301288 TaxID=3342077 RepID=UPI00385CEE25
MKRQTARTDVAATAPRSPAGSLRVQIVGAGIIALTAFIATVAGARMVIASAPDVATAALVENPVLTSRSSASALPVVPMASVKDVASLRPAGELAMARGWMYTSVVQFAPVESSEAEEVMPLPMPGDQVASAPVPLPKPRIAELSVSKEDMAQSEAEANGTLAAAPVPQSNPLRGSEPKVASLAPVDSAVTDQPPSATDPITGLSMPKPGDKFAIYDIKAKVVYMPNGERMEAHSGFGDMMDDIRHVTVSMRGPTPPNEYELYPREALFHGVEALRLRPVGNGKMYGRNGFLTHSYLLGERGDSNGCISFKDYDKFLAAYKRGEVKRVIVVAELPKSIAPPVLTPANRLLSWLNISK